MGLLLIVLAQVATNATMLPAASASSPSGPRTMAEMKAAIRAIPVPRSSPASWINPNAYPHSAATKGLTGKVDFALQIDARGMPVACVVTGTSGSPVLDKATCDSIVQKARFNPLPAGVMQLALRTYRSSVRWTTLRLADMPGPGKKGHAGPHR